MSFDYSKLNATAERLIARFGQDANLIRITNSGPTHDPTQTEESTAVKIAVFDYTMREREGSLIEETDKKVYISTDGVTDVLPADKLDIGADERLSVIRVMPLSPGGTVLFYEAQVRV